jgi:hypothetical protein
MATKGSGASRGRSQGAQSRNLRGGTRGKPEASRIPAPGAKRKLPTGAAELGSMKGNHVTERREASPRPVTGFSTAPGFQPVALGNTLTNNVGKGGPGIGRDVHGRGSCQETVVGKSEPCGAPWWMSNGKR